jgi:hypothetical protein
MMRYEGYTAFMGNEICIVLFWKQERKDHLEDPGIYGWRTLKPICNRMADMDWTDLAQHRDLWQAIANMVKL